MEENSRGGHTSNKTTKAKSNERKDPWNSRSHIYRPMIGLQIKRDGALGGRGSGLRDTPGSDGTIYPIGMYALGYSNLRYTWMISVTLLGFGEKPGRRQRDAKLKNM